MTTASDRRLKFSEFVDLVLTKLYEWDQASGGKLLDLNLINQELKNPVSFQWILDAGKVLQSRGLAEVIFAFGGYCSAQITGEGRLYVEEGRGSTKEYQEHPEAYFIQVSGQNNQVAIGGNQATISQSMTIEESRKPAFAAVEQIEKTLKQDNSLPAEQKDELLNDVSAIRQQLRKREPNRPALAALLEPISQIVSVAGEVAKLLHLLNV